MFSDPAIQFLFNSPDPSIRYFTLTDLLDASPPLTLNLPRVAGEGLSREVREARAEIPNGARVRALLAGQGVGKHKSKSFGTHAGGFGVHPYKNLSFYESLAPLWGLVEWHRVTQDRNTRRAADRAAEFFLRHRLFRSERTGAARAEGGRENRIDDYMRCIY